MIIKRYITTISNIILHLKTQKDITFKYPKLHMNYLKIVRYSYSSIATNDYHKSQICYLSFQAEKDKNCKSFIECCTKQYELLYPH